jgi:hypothetical protein
MTEANSSPMSPHNNLVSATSDGSATQDMEKPIDYNQPSSPSEKISPKTLWLETSNKKRSNINMEDATIDSLKKRTKNDDTRDVETVVTPTNNNLADDVPVDGYAQQDISSTCTDHPPLDLANTLGYKDGDRVEVQWEIHMDENDDQKNDGNVEAIQEDTSSTTTTSVWWKATLLEFDGRTIDSVAIRCLLYDARPDLGFPEPSKEDVIFMGHDLLVSPHDESVQLKYKREGLTEEENQLLVCNDDQLDEQLNQIVMATLQKNQHVWKAMPAAAQAAIAEKMQKMKEKMKEKLRALGPHVVITSETIRQLLTQSF